MWHIVEENDYERSVAQMGGAKWVDAALEPIMDGLEKNPLGFPEVPGLPGIRLARTRLSIRDLEIIPALRLWFRAEAISKTVYLLYVELAPPEDMEYGESLW